MVTRKRDQCDTGHIVRGTWTMVTRAAHDRDPNIAQDPAIRRRWSEERAHACGTRLEELQREAWSPKDLRTSQARAGAMKTGIR